MQLAVNRCHLFRCGSDGAAIARIANRAIGILDEVHHAGDALSWGDAVREAFGPAVRRLSLTGTPFRSDVNPIPFVTYAPGDDGIPRSVADYSYGYGRALADHVGLRLLQHAQQAVIGVSSQRGREPVLAKVLPAQRPDPAQRPAQHPRPADPTDQASGSCGHLGVVSTVEQGVADPTGLRSSVPPAG